MLESKAIQICESLHHKFQPIVQDNYGEGSFFVHLLLKQEAQIKYSKGFYILTEVGLGDSGIGFRDAIKCKYFLDFLTLSEEWFNTIK